MSDWLLAAGIPVSILAFYPLVIGLAQLKLVRTNPRLLKGLHLGGWGLTLLFFVIFLGWHISPRGQWFDVLPFGVAWVAAGSYFWLYRRQLSWPSKLYFGGWFGYPAALVLAYLADKIFFALAAFPLFAFLPNPTYYSSPTVTLRAPVSGLLSARRVQLLTPLAFVLEKHAGFAFYENLPAADHDNIIAVEPQVSIRPDSVKVFITTRQGRHLVLFSR